MVIVVSQLSQTVVVNNEKVVDFKVVSESSGGVAVVVSQPSQNVVIASGMVD